MNCSLLLLLSLALAGCSFTELGEPTAQGESAYTSNPRSGFYRTVEKGGRLYAQLANQPNTTCADDTISVRCPLGGVDLSALGLTSDGISHIEALLSKDVIVAYGKAYAMEVNGKKVLRLVVTRAFENLLPVFPQGDLYEVKALSADKPCTLARLLSHPGIFAPPSLETFAGICTHEATVLNSVERFDVDEPDWASREPWLPFGAPMDVVADLEDGASVLANGQWMSSRDAPFSQPTPIQVFRDVTRPEAN